MHLRHLALLPLLAVATAAAPFVITAKDLDDQGAKHLKQAKRILLPTLNLEVMNWGKITSVKQTSALQSLGGATNSTARATMEVAVPADVALLRGVAGELYADLAAKLKASGWEVVTFDQVKSDPGITGLKQESADPKLGAPVRKVDHGKQKFNYTIATPAGMPVLNHGMTVALWGMRSMLKAQGMSALEATYRFDPVALQDKGRHGITRNYAETSAEANLVLAHAQASFLTPKQFPGFIRLKKPIAVEGGIGEIAKLSDQSPAAANALSEALGKLAGVGSISASKGLYVCKLDLPELKQSLLIAGKAFNDELVRTIGRPE